MRLKLEYQGPAAAMSIVFRTLTAVLPVMSAVLSVSDTLGQVIPVQVFLSGPSTAPALTSDTWVDGVVEFLAYDVPGIPRGKLMFSVSLGGVFLIKAYVAPSPIVVTAYVEDTATYQEITATVVEAIAATPEATTVVVDSTAGSFAVDVASTTAAAEISGMTYEAWFNLYAFGVSAQPGSAAQLPFGLTLVGLADGTAVWR